MAQSLTTTRGLFERSFSFWLLLFSLPLLFLPKINLMSLTARESAGIRIDDLILFAFFLLIFWRRLVLNQDFSKIEWGIGLLSAFSLFSFFLNQIFVSFDLLHVHASLFYCLRLLEYFMFFYIGALASQFLTLRSIILALFIWNCSLMLLQRGGLIGQFSISGYLSSATDRVTGIASFPSEAGLLLNMLFCFLIYDTSATKTFIAAIPKALEKFFSYTAVYWLFLLCVTLVIFTGSRIAIVSLTAVFLFRIMKDVNIASLSSWLILLGFSALATLVIFNAITSTNSVAVRSDKLFSLRNVALVEKVWERIDVTHDPMGNESVRNQNYDTSWWIRIHKWCYALKIYLSHPENYLTGIGPGFAMAALDGGFLRILTEYGILGSFLFWKAFSPIYRQNEPLKWMIIVGLINMIFFDAYLAYKPMSLLFFTAGYPSPLRK